MVTKMLILVGFWLVGYAVSVLVRWYQSPKGFTVSSIVPQIVLSVVIALIASFFATKISLDGWLLWAIFAVGGFASGGILKFIGKKDQNINP